MEATLPVGSNYSSEEKSAKPSSAVQGKTKKAENKKESLWKRLTRSKNKEEDAVKRDSKAIAREVSVPKSAKLDDLSSRHQELMTRMKELCDSMERSKSRSLDTSAEAGLQPIPAETLESLNSSQQEVGGAIERLNGHLTESQAGQGRLVNSLEQVDKTMESVRGSSDRSVQAMEQVRSAADSMGMHVTQSHGKFEKLFGQMQEAERGFVSEFAKLQKRSTMLNIGLATAVVLSVAILGVIVLTVG